MSLLTERRNENVLAEMLFENPHMRKAADPSEGTMANNAIFQKAQRPGVMAEALLGIQSGNWERTFDDGKFSTRSSHP